MPLVQPWPKRVIGVLEIVEIVDVAADQHVAALQLLAEASFQSRPDFRRHFLELDHSQRLDRDFRKADIVGIVAGQRSRIVDRRRYRC